MDIFKKLIPSKRLRFKIISFFKFVPDKSMLKFQYKMKCHRKLNLKDPKRFTEKIQWYKLNYKDEKMPVCADKFAVREYIKKKGYGHLLKELYASFDSVDEINLNKLPDSFVLKLSNGSGTNIIVRDKSKISLDEIKKKFKDYYNQANTRAGREWSYHAIKPRIIAEEIIVDPGFENGIPNDFKVLCFYGEPKIIYRISDQYSDKENHLVYDTEWNQIKVNFSNSDCTKTAERPANLEEMISIAKNLSAGFPLARVDLFSINGRLYFGEITFFPWSGYMTFDPDSFDYKLGDMFTLPEKNN